MHKFVKHVGPRTSAHNSHMNGNAFEAFIGAIYLDRGYHYCMKFMQEQVFKRYINIEKVAATEENFKSRFIEWCQKYQLTFEFSTEDSLAKNGHTPIFHSTAIVEGIECGKGTGYSKKESQQHAAKAALSNIRKDKEFKKSLIEAKDKNDLPEASATEEAQEQTQG